MISANISFGIYFKHPADLKKIYIKSKNQLNYSLNKSLSKSRNPHGGSTKNLKGHKIKNLSFIIKGETLKSSSRPKRRSAYFCYGFFYMEINYSYPGV